MKLPWRKNQEKRAIDPSWAAVSMSPAALAVDARAAEQIATVTACVELVAGSLGSLPCRVYKQSAAGLAEDEAHPLARMQRSGPDGNLTWPELWGAAVADVLLRGNSLVEVVRDGGGRLAGLRWWPWGQVAVVVLPGGRVAYDVADSLGLHGPAGGRRRLLDSEVIHLKDRSDDGLIGRSRISRAAGAVSAALETQNFARAVHANRAAPSGVVEADGKLSPESWDALKLRLRETHQGVENSGKIMVFDQGLRYKPISISPEDAELLASRRFATEELARIFQVPPPLVGIWDHSSFTNSETAGRWFATHTLRPWCRRLEAAIMRGCFSSEAQRAYRVEFDLSDFLKGDDQTRWASYEIALRNKVLTPNEVRELEGWNPRPGGDGWGEEAAE